MKRDNSYGKEIMCKKCSKRFIKTKSTGNQCRSCRTQSYKIKSCLPVTRLRNSVLVSQSHNIEILNFIDKIDRRAGFLFSLTDLNDLLLHWNTITPVRSDKYDLQSTSVQLNNMWKDLVKWRDSQQNNI